MNVLQRLGVKAGWRWLEGNVGKKTLQRWLPVVGSAVFVIATVLRIFGNNEVASTVEAAGGVVGATQASPVPGEEIAAGVTQLVAALMVAWGIGRKVKASLPKPDDTVKPRTWPAGPAAVVILGLLFLPGCALRGSKALVQFGADAVKSPDPVTVFGWICANQPDRATAYLNFPDFGWVGQGGRDRYLVDALQKKAAGECPCAMKGCESESAKDKPDIPAVK